jgi:hypothetical protein
VTPFAQNQIKNTKQNKPYSLEPDGVQWKREMTINFEHPVAARVFFSIVYLKPTLNTGLTRVFFSIIDPPWSAEIHINPSGICCWYHPAE